MTSEGEKKNQQIPRDLIAPMQEDMFPESIPSEQRAYFMRYESNMKELPILLDKTAAIGFATLMEWFTSHVQHLWSKCDSISHLPELDRPNGPGRWRVILSQIAGWRRRTALYH